MTTQIIIVLFLTFVIKLVGTMAYPVRIVGVRTGKIAVSFAVFNIFVLVSRTANTFQAPLLAKTIETSINEGTGSSLLFSFRMILVAATIGTVVSAILMPTFIKMFIKLVNAFDTYRSIPKILIHGFSKGGIEQFKQTITVPTRENLSYAKTYRKIPKKLILGFIITTALTNTGALSSLYAGVLSPEFRTTCSTLSSVITGIATLLMFIFIDPYVSLMTDDVIKGKCSIIEFNRLIFFMVGSLIIGTILAQVLLVPAANIIVFIAEMI